MESLIGATDAATFIFFPRLTKGTHCAYTNVINQCLLFQTWYQNAFVLNKVVLLTWAPNLAAKTFFEF